MQEAAKEAKKVDKIEFVIGLGDEHRICEENKKARNFVLSQVERVVREGWI